MSDIEHELRSYTDATEPPAGQDAMAELVADLASEAHAAMMAEPVEPMATIDEDSDEIPF
jgi:hypothetical protein